MQPLSSVVISGLVPELVGIVAEQQLAHESGDRGRLVIRVNDARALAWPLPIRELSGGRRVALFSYEQDPGEKRGLIAWTQAPGEAEQPWEPCGYGMELAAGSDVDQAVREFFSYIESDFAE